MIPEENVQILHETPENILNFVEKWINEGTSPCSQKAITVSGNYPSNDTVTITVAHNVNLILIY